MGWLLAVPIFLVGIDKATKKDSHGKEAGLFNPLKINSKCLTGFAGITEFGVINEPILIKSFDH